MATASPIRNALLFGATSIIGHNLAQIYGEQVISYAPGKQKSEEKGESLLFHLNLEDSVWISEQLQQHKPSHIFYCHAVCNIGKCEAHPKWAQEINVEHVKRLVSLLPASTRLIYVSSDHVFGGDGNYDENSSPCPISNYGENRVQAEKIALEHKNSLVIRHGLPIGPSADGKSGHLDWLRYRSSKGLPLTIISDEHRSAVCTAALAKRIMDFATSQLTGIRHIPATRTVSRPELARFIHQQLKLTPTFDIKTRHAQSHPHLGHVALKSIYQDKLASALRSYIDQ